MDQHVPIPLPMGVRFYASDEDLIDLYLAPWVNNNFIDTLCFLQHIEIYECEPDFLIHPAPQDYFPTRQHWYFVTRQLLRGNRPNRVLIDPVLGGSWHFVGTKKIFRGLHHTGHKETLSFKTNNGLTTGWKLNEYRLATANNAFQTRGLVHLFYVPNEDQRNHFVDLGAVADDEGFDELDIMFV